MKNSTYNFVGNAEPVEIYKDNVDVMVCDGFVGNLLMKNIEAFARIIAKRGMVDDFIKRFNYEIYGGLPLLGANGVVIVGHGVSNEKAIKSMVLQSKNIYESNIINKLKAELQVKNKKVIVMSKIHAKITAVEGYAPEDVITNDDLSKMVDTNDEWIMSRIGIKTRHILKGDKGPSDMAKIVVDRILQDKGISPEEIGLVICCTVTPDMPFPATANIVADKCGIKNGFARHQRWMLWFCLWFDYSYQIY